MHFYNRVVYHCKLGDRAKTIESLKKVLELDPNHEAAKLGLASFKSETEN
jgi:Tfp pilus assembly protein PilF